MHTIALTRFNTETWNENKEWRKKHNWIGAVYGSPRRVSQHINPDSAVFILEMHNTQNKVKGISLIKPVPLIKGHYKIYSSGNYNRYTYASKYRVDRKELTVEEKKIIRIFDVLLFKGKRHLKRAQGITELPTWISKTKHIDFIQFFRTMFKNRWNHVLLHSRQAQEQKDKPPPPQDESRDHRRCDLDPHEALMQQYEDLV